MAKHGIFESTRLQGARNVSMQATEDVDNGSIVARGELVTGEKDVYVAKKPTTTDKVYFVGHPVYGYDERTLEERNEDNYTNVKGTAFRTYSVEADDHKVTVNDVMVKQETGGQPIKAGQYVVADGTYVMQAVIENPTATHGFVGLIEEVRNEGFEYFGGQYKFDTAVKKVKIRIIKNENM